MPNNGNGPINIGGINTTNQTGGVNNQTFNFQPPPRTLDQQAKDFLLHHIGAGKSFKIDSPISDAEAFNFAEQIRQFLEANGRVLAPDGLSSSVCIPPHQPGVGVNITVDPIAISVGPRA